MSEELAYQSQIKPAVLDGDVRIIDVIFTNSQSGEQIIMRITERKEFNQPSIECEYRFKVLRVETDNNCLRDVKYLVRASGAPIWGFILVLDFKDISSTKGFASSSYTWEIQYDEAQWTIALSQIVNH